jgi:predicted phosphodiesterase
MFCPNCRSSKLIKSGYDCGKQRYQCKVCGRKTVHPIEDLELVEENVKLAKQKQSIQDLNRIERKSFREYARIENAVAKYTKRLSQIFDKYKLTAYTKKHIEDTKCGGVLQLSDIHFNELIQLEVNQYDFEIASKRCKYFVKKATKYFKAFGVTNILLAMTGDLLNSDRRLDELLNMATNRAKATFLAVDIIQQVILDLNSNFNVSVAMVTGNESRVKKDWGWSKILASDNYDFTIFKTLEYLFKDSDINFIDGDPTELVVEVAGQNLLMLHGNGSIKKGLDTSVTQIMGRYSARGIKLDYLIFGHIHSARISDRFSRSSSMCGSNEYSEKGLGLSGRASQNCYIFYENGNRDGIKVDLQNYTDDMYDIDKSLESYNAKSHDKINKGTTIFKVVV